MHPSSSQSPNNRLGNDQLTIMFEHCTDQLRYPDSSPTSGRSSPTNSSLPCTPVDSFSRCPLDAAVAGEDSWNLIPYDVPWGPEYYHYRAGTLPGPEGACIFLRSPTPVKNRRTQKACNKCRQRKAKCSGTRPACMRCLARGYICEYVEEEKRMSAHSATRAHRQREHSASSTEPAETSDSMSDYDPSDYVLPKQEPGLSTPELTFTDAHAGSYEPAPAHAHAPSHLQSHYDEPQPQYLSHGYELEGPIDAYDEFVSVGGYYDQAGYTVPQDSSQMYHPATDHHFAASSVHAPRPVRCTASPTFLSPQERFASSFDAQVQHCDPMLINLRAVDDESMPQIALPQVPPMAPAGGSQGNAIEYAQPQYTQNQEMFFYPQAEVPMPLHFPYMQYPYAVQTYAPGPGVQEPVVPTMLYPVPMLPVGMMA